MSGLSREDIDNTENLDEVRPLRVGDEYDERELPIRPLSERSRQWSPASVASGCLCVVLVVSVVYFLAPATPFDRPPVIDGGEGLEHATAAPTVAPLAPTNERIKLADKQAITDLFGGLGPKRIFFIVVPHTYDMITDMALCAVESAARTNPDYNVLLLQVVDNGGRDTGAGIPKGSATAEAREGVFGIDNVFVADMNISDAFQGTILEEFYNETLSTAKMYRGQHIANFGRFQMMYDYGGVYSDTDAIFFGNVSKFHNVIGYEGQTRRDPPAQGYQVVNNAVLMYEPKHPFMYEFVKRYRDEYNNTKKIWAVVVGTVLGSECTDHPELDFCQNATFAEPKEFYYIGWGGALHYLIKRSDDEKKFDSAVQAHRETTICHLWNSFKEHTGPFEQGVPATEDVLYGKLMKDQCPWLFDHQYSKS